MGQDDDLKKRLESLERENKELKNAIGRGAAPNKTIRCTVGEYMGHPTITFETGGRPFSLGLRKAAIVLRCIEYVKRFVTQHNAEIKDCEVVDEDSEEKGDSHSDNKI